MDTVAPPAAARFAWWNGEIRLAKDLAIAPWTNALHYGTGVFEGIRCYPTAGGPAVFRLADHMSRLVRSASFHHLAVPFSIEDLSNAALELVRREGLDGLYLRPVVFYGEGPPHMMVKKACPANAMILTRPLGAFMGEENYKRGIRVTVSSWKRIHHSALPATAKGSGQYLSSVLAAHEAGDRGFDDALFLTMEGWVSECTGANVFFVKKDRVVTNDALSSILPGITRDSVLEICRRQSIDVEVRAFTLAELYDADEVFITGTAAEVTPVREIEARSFKTGAGTFTHNLQQRYKDIVMGKNAAYESWLAYARD
jgi:branched-chain amino acid aminotransferase